MALGFKVRSAARALVPVALLLTLGQCTQPRLRAFLPVGVSFERTFGQLYRESGTTKVSHYAVVSVGTESVRTIATGTVEYLRNFDAMGNCLLLRPKKYFSTPNDVSKLVGLPKPGALTIAFCNLDEPSVSSAIQALYADRLPAAEAPSATARFLDHDSDFTRVDVRAHESNLAQSTSLGRASGGKLYVAAYSVPEGETERRYVNPYPYLAAIRPALAFDTVPPTLEEITFESSASGTFAADRTTHLVVGGSVAAPIPHHHLRIAVRAAERTSAGGARLAPYRFHYELFLLTLTGGTEVSRERKARGTALMNSLLLADVDTLAAAYGSAPPVASDPSGVQWLFLPWGSAVDGDEAINVTSTAAVRSVDLSLSSDGTPAFPTGAYELVVTVDDGITAPVAASTLKVRFDLAAGVPPAGDSELTYAPVSGPIGSAIAVTAATTGAFATDTTVEFTGTFDPDGVDGDGADLGPTPSFVVSYPSSKLRVVDAQHLTMRIGEVLPAGGVLAAANLRYGNSGRLSGSLRVRTPSTGYDHTTPGVAFVVVGSTRFGYLVDGALAEPDTLPILHASSAAEVAAAPDFQRLVAEWWIPPPDSGSPPATVDVVVRSLDSAGAFLDQQPHTLGLVGEVGGMVLYRSAEGGGRKLVLVADPAYKGPQGSDVLAVQVEPDGSVRLDGSPP